MIESVVTLALRNRGKIVSVEAGSKLCNYIDLINELVEFAEKYKLTCKYKEDCNKFVCENNNVKISVVYDGEKVRVYMVIM